ncbi:unnamed protein product [Cylicostephanus goldi]|uniref:Uncharacterized protein n=1 Tax=Cylicostephanus goldi TaxID=71465 RepID=A0A3P6SVJ0_CYLGO|nr:unnamed protein product [Cylicostephanus goldi]
MSNGLFPGHHGIVSNHIYDLNLSSKPAYLGTTSADGYYTKEPIWSIYQRETRRHAATISWIGSYHNTTYYQQPHYMVPFDKTMTADGNFDKVSRKGIYGRCFEGCVPSNCFWARSKPLMVVKHRRSMS